MPEIIDQQQVATCECGEPILKSKYKVGAGFRWSGPQCWKQGCAVKSSNGELAWMKKSGQLADDQ